MLYSDGAEFILIASFLLLTLFVQRFAGLKVQKWWLLIGSATLLLTIINFMTLGIHVAISAAVFWLGSNQRIRNRRWVGWSIATLVLLFVLRNYQVLKGIETDGFLPASFFIGRLGISYMLFRHIQFLVDSHSQKVKQFSFPDYLSFILFFPNFLAGPIDVYSHFQHWLNKEFGRTKKSLVLPGIGRIALGLIKKYGIVPLFYAEAVNYELLAADLGPWLGVLSSLFLYSFYIFLDFSGYSDIAIGTGYVLGIKTPENFRSPYLSLNIAAFWRRWHMTFSDFLRNLIFVPIVKTLAARFQAWPRLSVSMIGYILTFVICGAWHGTSLNFIYWGLWHGLGLAVYKAWDLSVLKPRLTSDSSVVRAAGDLSSMGLTFAFVSVGWVFFNYSPGRLGKIVELLF